MRGGYLRAWWCSGHAAAGRRGAVAGEGWCRLWRSGIRGEGGERGAAAPLVSWRSPDVVATRKRAVLETVEKVVTGRL
jgi:hypothetical protein